MSMHPSVVSAFPAKRLIIKIVRAVVPQESADKGKLENRKRVGRREAEWSKDTNRYKKVRKERKIGPIH